MDLYCVYEHVFPNGKRYIGITRNDPEYRFMTNGNGYSTQKKMFNAIKKYGWDNIQHNVIVDGLTNAQANIIEKYLIKSLNTIQNGYNTSIGGDSILGVYLNQHVLRMLREYKQRYGKESYDNNPVIYLINEARKNPEYADTVNNADEAVMKKHGNELESSNVRHDEYLYYMWNFFELNRMVQDGEDTSKWQEKPYAQWIYDQLFGNEGKV